MDRTVLRSPPGNRRQPLLEDQSTRKVKEKRRFGEVAGGTAAECAAICCCCPCSMMNLLILAVYKIPVGLCRKVWTKKRKQHHIANKKKSLLHQRPTAAGGGFEYPNENDGQGESLPSSYFSSEDGEMEKEIWERFYGTGFWRTDSQRET